MDSEHHKCCHCAETPHQDMSNNPKLTIHYTSDRRDDITDTHLLDEKRENITS